MLINSLSVSVNIPKKKRNNAAISIVTLPAKQIYRIISRVIAHNPPDAPGSMPINNTDPESINLLLFF